MRNIWEISNNEIANSLESIFLAKILIDSHGNHLKSARFLEAIIKYKLKDCLSSLYSLIYSLLISMMIYDVGLSAVRIQHFFFEKC